MSTQFRMEDKIAKEGTGRQEYAAEFAGTMIMIFIGLTAVSLNFGEDSPVREMIVSDKVRLLLTGIIFAGGGTAVVYSPLGTKSGGHLNPAITAAFYLKGKLSGIHSLWYMTSQFVGAVAGAFLTRLLWTDLAVSVNLGATHVREDVGFVSGGILEFSMVAALVVLVFVFTSEKRLAPFTGVAAGLTVALFVFLTAPLTGTSLNPARSLGPALVMNSYGQIAFYLVVPFLGSAAGLAVHNYLIRGRKPLCGKIFHRKKDPGCIFIECSYKKRTVPGRGERRKKSHSCGPAPILC